MNKIKKIAKWTGKGILTAIAFSINPVFGFLVGIGLFLGWETFASTNR
jgi:uncharacterized membrane protein